MQLWTVDAFTQRPFHGNPAAVIIGDAFPTAVTMQAIAAEMNLSETAFLCPLGPQHYHIRWFTPMHEVRLCGHATLATGHILWEEQRESPDVTLTFDSLSGPLQLTRAANGRITLDFPAQRTETATPPEGLVAALGQTPRAVHRAEQGPALPARAASAAGGCAAEQGPALPARAASAAGGCAADDWLLEMESESVVRALQPNFAALMQIDCRAVLVTARADNGHPYDFVSRYFAPRGGIPEDPVTGSAHCKLTPYWAAQLGRPNLTAYQASARGGTLYLKLRSDRVHIAGDAVTILRGELSATER